MLHVMFIPVRPEMKTSMVKDPLSTPIRRTRPDWY